MSRGLHDPFQTPDGARARSVEDRVRDLRLPDRVDSGAGGGAGRWLPWVLCAILAVVSVSLGYQVYAARARSTAGAAKSATPSSAAKSDQPKETEKAESGSLVLESKGYIVPAHQIQVSPIEVAGRIKEIYFEEGRWFEKDQVLAKIDDAIFDADAKEARATVAATKARWDEMRANWGDEIKQAEAELGEAAALRDKFDKEYQRVKDISGDSGATAKKEQDDALYNFKAQQQRVLRMESALRVMKGPREERIKAAEAEFRQAEARLEKAEWRLRNCTIKAPVSGNILSKKAEIGNLVSPMSFNVSATLCEMADLTKLEVDLEVQEREIAKIELGQKCKVRCDAYPSRTWEGEVIRIMPVALRAKSAVQVRVQVLNIPKEEAGKFLRPDMGALVSFYAK